MYSTSQVLIQHTSKKKNYVGFLYSWLLLNHTQEMFWAMSLCHSCVESCIASPVQFEKHNVSVQHTKNVSCHCCDKGKNKKKNNQGKSLKNRYNKNSLYTFVNRLEKKHRQECETCTNHKTNNDQQLSTLELFNKMFFLAARFFFLLFCHDFGHTLLMLQCHLISDF